MSELPLDDGPDISAAAHEAREAVLSTSPSTGNA
jgi:hypothetical protein